MIREIPKLNNKQINKFWTNVGITAQEQKCWEWQLMLTPQGYGVVQITPEYKKKSKAFVASRVAYFLHYGVDPKEYFVCHKCDNPKCVNPNHLFLGNQKENIRDMFSKNRQNKAKGEKQPFAKLTDEEVLYIRANYPGDKTQRQWAKDYNVSPSTICELIKRKRWTHI